MSRVHEVLGTFIFITTLKDVMFAMVSWLVD